MLPALTTERMKGGQTSSLSRGNVLLPPFAALVGCPPEFAIMGTITRYWELSCHVRYLRD